ncbi:DeoR/GlpR family DNA-binding transcription regulator [Photobacterium aphoticum]|nr:DeoR/GlpR family DNA-binding transcription regulator [Photobacterium aphoticum]
MKTAIERRMEIVNIVGLRGKVHVDDLATLFNVTGATIRADLRFLEQNGFIVRSYGFAIMNKGALNRFVASQKDQHVDDSKAVDPNDLADVTVHEQSDDLAASGQISDQNRHIGQIITGLLDANSTIFIDANDMIRHSLDTVSDFASVAIITHDLGLMQQLVKYDSLDVIMPGGTVNPDTMQFTGAKMLNSLKCNRFNKAIIKVDGFNKKLGFFAQSEFDAELAKVLCQISEEVIVVADSKTLASSNAYWIGDVDMIDTLVSDQNLPDDLGAYLESKSVTVITANG